MGWVKFLNAGELLLGTTNRFVGEFIVQALYWDSIKIRPMWGPHEIVLPDSEIEQYFIPHPHAKTKARIEFESTASNANSSPTLSTSAAHVISLSPNTCPIVAQKSEEEEPYEIDLDYEDYPDVISQLDRVRGKKIKANEPDLEEKDEPKF